MSEHPVIVVIGGGLIGACVAFELHAAGLRPVVLDAGKAGAAWRASAGLLAPHAEGLRGDLATDGREALNIWPDFARRLEAHSGLKVGFRRGLLRGAAGGEGAGTAERAQFSPDEGSVHPPSVRAAALAGLDVRTAEVTGLHARADGVRVKAAGGGHVDADVAVIAAGAWSGAFGLPVAPAQGQALLLDADLPRAVYAGPLAYAVPRTDGVYVGATRAPVWSSEPDAAARAHLERVRDGQFPTLRGARVRAHLVGLRPCPEGGVPLVGPHPAVPRALVATGHDRNGVLLAPLTARRVRDACLALVAGVA